MLTDSAPVSLLLVLCVLFVPFLIESVSFDCRKRRKVSKRNCNRYKTCVCRFKKGWTWLRRWVREWRSECPAMCESNSWVKAHKLFGTSKLWNNLQSFARTEWRKMCWYFEHRRQACIKFCVDVLERQSIAEQSSQAYRTVSHLWEFSRISARLTGRCRGCPGWHSSCCP